MDFHGNINLKDNEMQGLVMQQEQGFPVDAVAGSIVFNDNTLYMAVALNDTDPIWIPLTSTIDTYVYEQEAASTSWTITHSIGEENMLVQVFDDNNNMVIPDTVTPTDTDELVVTFSTAVAGRVVLMYGDEVPANGVGILTPALTWSVNVSNLTYDNKSVNVGSGSSTPSVSAIRFNPDGTKMFVVGLSFNTLVQYSLSVAYDVSTATYDNIDFDFATWEGQTNGIAFNADGTKMYMTGSLTGGIYQFSLPTPYILTGMVYDNVSRPIVGIQDNASYGLAFNDSGTILHRILSGAIIERYDLSVGFDLSTAVWDTQQHLLGNEVITTQTRELLFNPDGTEMYVLGPGHLYRYTLGTAFDVSTFVFEELYTIAEDGVCEGFVFSPDADKVYIVGRAGSSVYQYSTNI